MSHNKKCIFISPQKHARLMAQHFNKVHTTKQKCQQLQKINIPTHLWQNKTAIYTPSMLVPKYGKNKQNQTCIKRTNKQYFVCYKLPNGQLINPNGTPYIAPTPHIDYTRTYKMQQKINAGLR